MRVEARTAVASVLDDVAGLPAFLAGSAAAAVWYGKPEAYNDVDIFVPNPGVYFTVVERLRNKGWETDDRFTRMMERHLSFGFNGWHTNSMKLTKQLNSSVAVDATEVNVIYKRVDGHETTRLSQVIESFDFGLLGVGYETLTGRLRSMYDYLFPGQDPMGPLPMIDYRRKEFERGRMSQHVMQRTPGRYARYHRYGYDMSSVKDTLLRAYFEYATYMLDRDKEEKRTLGQLALALGEAIRDDRFDWLVDFEAKLPTLDGLDEIMETLE